MDWIVSNSAIEYQYALNWMEIRVAEIIAKKNDEAIWLLEHNDVYTAGTSADINDLKEPNKFPVVNTNRGGKFTYHGPGQRIIYVMIRMERFNLDVRKYAHFLEELVIKSLSDFNIACHRFERRIGVWTYGKLIPGLSNHLEHFKIASIGVRIRQKVAFHGIAVNICPNLKNFDGIIPCGLDDVTMTSIINQGEHVTTEQFDNAIKSNFHAILN